MSRTLVGYLLFNCLNKLKFTDKVANYWLLGQRKEKLHVLQSGKFDHEALKF